MPTAELAPPPPPEVRREASVDEPASARWFTRLFARFEDLVYVGLGVLLAASAIVLLGHAVWLFVQHLVAGSLPDAMVGLLDRLLLILINVEVLYTVQVSLREHSLAPEPFLVVALIAAVRRVLVLTAEFSKLLELGDVAFRTAMIELGLLTVLIVALVVSLALLRRRGAPRPA
jgi:uncharacterized membrane protein (DUF373 family)